MRFASLGLLGVVAYCEEVVAQSPSVCSCTAELSQCTTKYETEMKALENRLTSSWTETMDRTKKGHSEEVQKMNDQLQDYIKKNSEAQALITTLQSKGSSEVSALQKSLASLQEEHAKKMKSEAEAKAQQEAELTKARSLVESSKHELENIRSRHEREIQSWQSQLSDSMRAVEELNRKVDSFERVIFSQEHFDVMTRNLMTIVGALSRNAKANINRIFNADVFELGRLQSLVMYNKVRPYTDAGVERVSQFLAQHEVLDRVRDLQEASSPYMEQARDFVEKRMDRIVSSLSATNPSIRSMFPEAFKDRLIAFAYLFCVFYMASNVFNAVFSVIASPFHYVVSGRSHSSRKSNECGDSDKCDSQKKGKNSKRGRTDEDEATEENRIGRPQGESISTIKHRKL